MDLNLRCVLGGYTVHRKTLLCVNAFVHTSLATLPSGEAREKLGILVASWELKYLPSLETKRDSAFFLYVYNS